jgi:hypothetical protein
MTHDVVDASWAKLTDAQLIKQSDIIVIGELIGQTDVKMAPVSAEMTLGVLQVEEVLKGEQSQNVILLELPYSRGLRNDAEVFYKKGQKGLWFLRLRAPREAGIYLADHPQRFLSVKQVSQIETFRKLLQK